MLCEIKVTIPAVEDNLKKIAQDHETYFHVIFVVSQVRRQHEQHGGQGGSLYGDPEGRERKIRERQDNRGARIVKDEQEHDGKGEEGGS